MAVGSVLNTTVSECGIHVVLLASPLGVSVAVCTDLLCLSQSRFIPAVAASQGQGVLGGRELRLLKRIFSQLPIPNPPHSLLGFNVEQGAFRDADCYCRCAAVPISPAFQAFCCDSSMPPGLRATPFNPPWPLCLENQFFLWAECIWAREIWPIQSKKKKKNRLRNTRSLNK